MKGELTARIAGTGSYLPEASMDNYELFERESIRNGFDLERARSSLQGVENVADLPAAEIFHRWAVQVTGIRERRVLLRESGLRTEDMCAEAARRALEMAGLEPSDLDAILVGSVTPADDVPNMACTVAEILGVPKVGGFTLNAACAGFIYALATGWSMIRSGMMRRVMAISGDALTRITDYDDPKTAVLFGDGAGAALLEAGPEGEGVLGTPHLSGDYEREPLYMVGAGQLPDVPFRPTLRMGGGPRILRRAISAMAEAGEIALRSAGRSWEEVDFVVPHQANLRITRGLEKQLPLEKGRVLHNIERYGNMSASTVGVGLDQAVRGEHGPLPARPLIVLTAVGGGYTSAGMVIQQAGFPAAANGR